jgi:hypothetical protein
MEVASLAVPGLETDADYRAQYAWLSPHGLDGCAPRNVRIDQVRKGEHDGHYVINGRVRATFEHPFLVRRGDQWGFASAHLLEVGDFLIVPAAGGGLAEERITSLDARAGVVRTVTIHVPGTNMFLADGAWTHNDMPSFDTFGSPSSGSGSGSGSGSSSGSSSGSGSGGGKSSGSSFNSDSGGTPSASVWSQSSQSYNSGGGGGGGSLSGGGGIDSGGGGGWGQWGNGHA